ncbi:PqqD family peptide modification chaperone [Emticicia sp. CRIBPO]|uniref:PqqD family protein n=1 Tax=Emticicia sp. CRIBPO TaxID=2683258 RepID=UPI001411D4B0|nr:PqqD family protein [Emticicia sp. CRIBPO]NBA85207.1 PqqD family peptide modification chaperone [Emticicia sp. CRIBPO]
MKIIQLDSSNIAKEVFDNEVVMINIPLGKYYSVRGSAGVRVLEILEQPATHEEITKTIAAEYEVSHEQAAADVDAFLQHIENESLVLESREPAVEPAPLNVAVKQAYAIPALEVFDDMQELILLDPVHDVESFKGWPQKKDGSTD